MVHLCQPSLCTPTPIEIPTSCISRLFERLGMEHLHSDRKLPARMFNAFFWRSQLFWTVHAFLRNGRLWLWGSKMVWGFCCWEPILELVSLFLKPRKLRNKNSREKKEILYLCHLRVYIKNIRVYMGRNQTKKRLWDGVLVDFFWEIKPSLLWEQSTKAHSKPSVRWSWLWPPQGSNHQEELSISNSRLNGAHRSQTGKLSATCTESELGHWSGFFFENKFFFEHVVHQRGEYICDSWEEAFILLSSVQRLLLSIVFLCCRNVLRSPESNIPELTSCKHTFHTWDNKKTITRNN